MFKLLKNRKKNVQGETTDNTDYTERFNNVMAFADDLLFLTKCNPSCKDQKIYDFITMLADVICSKQSMKCIECSVECFTSSFLNIFIPSNKELNQKYNLFNRIEDDMFGYKVENVVTVNLGFDPVLTFPWSKDRLSNAVKTVATEDNSWVDNGTHDITIIFPVGLSYVVNGNHSVFAGILSKQGTVTVTPSSEYPNSRHQICSWTPLYDYIKFDGRDYIFTGFSKEEQLNIIIGAAPSIELGYIFEIGRKLAEYGSSFKNTKITRR